MTLAVISGSLLVCAPAASAQDVTESSLKAAYVLNFVRYTTWPRDVLPPAAPLKACVLGDAAFGDALTRYVKGVPVDGHSIVVSTMAADGLLKSCHVLYVSGVPAKQAASVADSVSGFPVLTLSDAEQFANARGGIAQFYGENGRLRFGVNLSTTKRSRLQISSRLLDLATIIDDDRKQKSR